MRIFGAGLATETNTFSNIPTGEEDFMVQRGADVLAGRIRYPSLDLSMSWGARARQRGDEFIFSLYAWAQPGGPTVRSVYESFRDEILRDLESALPVDVVLLTLHGAMIADEYDDCEQDLIRHVREVVGQRVVVGVLLDLHANLSAEKISAADIVITYKEYPHVDINDRANELFDLAIATALGDMRPTMSLFDCCMIGLYPTSRQPLRGFVDSLSAAEQRTGVLAVSFAHGFQFADLTHVGAKMLVVADNDPVLARRVAQEFGMKVHAIRADIGFDSLSLPIDVALPKALANTNTPVVVADQSDNPGAGAPGDSTFALRWLLDHEVADAAIAILHDPEVVKIARKAGVGAELQVRLGGKIGPSSGDPLDIDVTVRAIREEYMHVLPQRSGPALECAVGDVVALSCRGIDIVVGSKRCQCFEPGIFTDLGIDAARKRLLLVKSAQHFHDAFAPIASEIIYMSAPGAVPPDPRQIRYQQLDTSRVYPWSEQPTVALICNESR
jgi:microcystin degradation protein MlrC